MHVLLKDCANVQEGEDLEQESDEEEDCDFLLLLISSVILIFAYGDCVVTMINPFVASPGARSPWFRETIQIRAPEISGSDCMR